MTDMLNSINISFKTSAIVLISGISSVVLSVIVLLSVLSGGIAL
ncbi:MAG: hypothetical protein BWY60_00916 [Actinobacteria bacterium ADurb.Bin346]|nr:MAG: hypothetical protein BWY60_00916 [Actinobacteria bacterium ADurb.Bin346]